VLFLGEFLHYGDILFLGENSVFQVKIQKKTKTFGKICQTFLITKLKEKNPLHQNMVLVDYVSYLCHF